MIDDAPSSLLYWYPKIKDVVLMPKTEWYLTPDPYCGYDLIGEGNGEWTSWWDERLLLIQQFAESFGFPCFMRTDLFSGKHSWKDTCYVPDGESVIPHLKNLISDSLTCDFMGLPTRAIVFREWLPLYALFKAFWGKMPVARERRYFIRDGQVEVHFPYWPAGAIRENEPDDPNWETLLAELNREEPQEIEQLMQMALNVGQVLPGYWSVDFAQHQDGRWFLIDMAVGDRSWKPEAIKT